MNHITPLHLFNHYLPLTENWLYALIRHIPGVENHIAARRYLKHNFYGPKFKFAESYLGEMLAYNNVLTKSRLLDLFQKVVVHSLPFLLGSDEGRLIRYAKHHQINILHAHFAPVGWRYRKVAKALGTPFVVSFYGYDYEMVPYTEPAFRQRYQWLFQFADAFICEGPHGASILEQMGCPAGKIYIVPLGVEVEKIPFFERDKIPGELKLIQVASFAEKKGHIYTVMAFAEALKQCPNMELTLVGDAREPIVKKKVLDFIADNQLGDKIRVLDWLDYSQVHQFLSRFHVFIHPSCYAQNRDCEGGAPIILLDAQATGMPVIGTTHCDFPFAVKDGVAGRLSPEKEIRPLKEAIGFFYSQGAEEYSAWSQNARGYIAKNFDIRHSSKLLADVYKNLIDQEVSQYQ